MKLHNHDMIEIAGIHPTNPITGVVIPEYLVAFQLTQDVDGDHINPVHLHPRLPAGDDLIAVSRIVRLNGRMV